MDEIPHRWGNEPIGEYVQRLLGRIATLEAMNQNMAQTNINLVERIEELEAEQEKLIENGAQLVADCERTKTILPKRTGRV